MVSASGSPEYTFVHVKVKNNHRKDAGGAKKKFRLKPIVISANAGIREHGIQILNKVRNSGGMKRFSL
jgi:hypothetical protein